jgi:Rps23 Pro-64 3,4-dihydroxylase Tpa1-like proline 4-hydroxylase
VSDPAEGPRKLALGNFAFSFSAPASAAPAPAPLPAPHAGESWFVIDDFLPEPLAEQITNSFILCEREFVRAWTTSLVADYRQALEFPRRLNEFLPFEMRLYKILPDVCRRLGMPGLNIQSVDIAGNAYPNGGLFKKHYDNGALVNASRTISYVYYLHKRPQRFHGGDLVIYPLEDGMLVEEPKAVVPPKHNSIVFFRSEYLHEVLPVVVPSGAFADSRFTINGWVHSDDPATAARQRRGMTKQ